MSAIRSIRSAETKFVQLSNTAAQDKRLSARAKGVIFYTLSCPPWQNHTSDSISEAMAEGRDAIRTALRELREYGYAVHRKQQLSNGRWVSENFISDQPITDEMITNCIAPQTSRRSHTYPQTENPEPGNPSSVPPAQTDVSPGHTEDGFPAVGKPGPKRFNTASNTSSSNTVGVAVDKPALAPKKQEQEEEIDLDLKRFVAALDYGEETPSRQEYVRIAKAAKRVWGKVDSFDLKQRLSANMHNAHSRVALYVTRLNELTVDDFTPKPASRGPSPRRSQWCCRPAVCDPNTRKLIDDRGFVGGEPCPVCS